MNSIAIRTRIELPAGMDEAIRHQLALKLATASTFIERGTVRFDDVNGPKGGVDTICRIKLVLRGRPSVQVEERGTDARAAFARALPTAVRAVQRVRGKHALRGNPRPALPQRGRPREAPPNDRGELIGRRVGHGKQALAAALARPEKEHRDAYVDTALPGVSATDRRAGGTSTARRNARARTTRATSMLEDSRTVPSRKSTRRSANRGKPSHGKERTALGRALTPSARGSRRGG
jgi:hypothetical protein